jgi:hypothetical protein
VLNKYFSYPLFLYTLLILIWSSSASESEDLPKRSWFIDMGKFASSSHGRLVCSECHSDIEEKGVKHPDLKFLNRDSTLLYDYKKCERCHPQEYQRYLKGAHAKALLEKKKNAPTCGNCHVAHYVLFNQVRLELGRWMTEMCGVCHPIEKWSYLDNYHGKAAASLGYEASAYCTDCHGAHTCLSLKKKEIALEMCQKCHPNAQIQFTGFVIHASEESLKKEDMEKRSKVRVIHWIEIGFGILVFLVLAFFYSHTLVWILRKVHEWLKRD